MSRVFAMTKQLEFRSLLPIIFLANLFLTVLAWHILCVLYSLYKSIDDGDFDDSNAVPMRSPGRARAPAPGRGKTSRV